MILFENSLILLRPVIRVPPFPFPLFPFCPFFISPFSLFVTPLFPNLALSDLSSNQHGRALATSATENIRPILWPAIPG